MPFRAITAAMGISLGGVQKSVRRAQKFADALATGSPGDVVAVVDDEHGPASAVRHRPETQTRCDSTPVRCGFSGVDGERESRFEDHVDALI